MNDLETQSKDRGLSIISVNTDNALKDAKEFLEDVPDNFIVIYDADGEVVAEYKVQAMPSSFLFDKQGKLIVKHLGFKRDDIEKITAEIELLLTK